MRRCVVIAIDETRNHNEYGKLEKLRGRLRSLPDRKLLGDLNGINRKELNLRITSLLYLAEIDKRELYLPLGYPSLFEFCVSRLGYTRATAGRWSLSPRTKPGNPTGSIPT